MLADRQPREDGKSAEGRDTAPAEGDTLVALAPRRARAEVTAEDVREVARRVIDFNHSALAILYDRALRAIGMNKRKGIAGIGASRQTARVEYQGAGRAQSFLTIVITLVIVGAKCAKLGVLL